MDIVYGVVIGLMVGAAVMLIWRRKNQKQTTERQSVILLEKIKSVCRLITVEGDFSEIYHYEDKKEHFLNLMTSKKKALVLIHAKVHIGYDLKQVHLKADTRKKTIVLTRFPQPQLLSIEPNLQYYDIQNSLFNKFDSADLSQLNREAKQHIEDKIPESGLMDTARKEAVEAVMIIEKIVEAIGWRLDYSALEINNEVKTLKTKSDAYRLDT
ncbi:MAG: DUF4230 domain-containing protein [Flavobacteriaceae bacterium]|nr:DUF4230 domain-containing protein [Flavobacteriaceae bacterium]